MPTAPDVNPFAGRSVLIIDQGLLKDRKGKPVHGVELFRLHLARQLLGAGVRVVLAIEPSWRPTLAAWFAGDGRRPDLFVSPPFGATLPGATWAALRAGAYARRLGLPGGRFDAVVFGNIGKGHLAAMHVARRLGVGRRLLGFAHRRSHPRVVRAARRMGLPVVAVSEHVAARFHEHGHADVSIMYGLPNADAFHPPADGQRRPDDGLTHFIMLARLPNISKGLDKAVDAFGLLPAEVRERSRLHLAAFVGPPDHPKIAPSAGADPNIIAHRWTPADDVPALLRRMDVMLCLSRKETFSQAIVQGMLTGLPIVATPIDVYVEKLDTGGGIIADDPASIARAMVDLAASPERRWTMGEVGRVTALERYVWSTPAFLERLFGHGGAGVGR